MVGGLAVDVRSARAFDPVAVRELVQEYTGSTSVPVLFCSVRYTVLHRQNTQS